MSIPLLPTYPMSLFGARTKNFNPQQSASESRGLPPGSLGVSAVNRQALNMIMKPAVTAIRPKDCWQMSDIIEQAFGDEWKRQKGTGIERFLWALTL
jgi:hypothetical protein